ncbi:MAG: arsenic metallochaperone ArsD family protein [Rhodospirillales bacterium]|nr:arsenic metallochaperone ArsD family protein [Rhodospirillales bacterium]
MEWLAARGVEVTRHNLGHDPGAFVRNALVKSTLDREGLWCLPMILVDGTVAKKGGYLTREDFMQLLNLESESRTAPKAPAISENRRKAS